MFDFNFFIFFLQFSICSSLGSAGIAPVLDAQRAPAALAKSANSRSSLKLISSRALLEEINLYKNRITWYGTTRSYEEPSMDFWIKEYFNIPQDVEFKWIDIYNKVR